MKKKLIICSCIIATLCSCSSSKKIVELQNKIDRLEFNLLKELTENAVITNTKNEWKIECIKTKIWISEEDRYKEYDRTITFDSLKTKYNLLLDNYDKLKVPYFAFKVKADSVTSKNSEAIMKLVDEYKMLRDSTKKSSK